MKKLLTFFVLAGLLGTAITQACDQNFNFTVRHQSTYDFWDDYSNNNNYVHQIQSWNVNSPLPPGAFSYVGPWDVPANSTHTLVQANGYTVSSTSDFTINYEFTYTIPGSNTVYDHLECAYYDVTYCGDGNVDTPGPGDSRTAEECDDGNNTNGDGCENNCTTTPVQPVECVSASVNPSGNIEVGSTYTITCDGNNETAFDVKVKRNGSTLGTYSMSPSGNQWTYSYSPSQAGSYQFICIAKNPSASPSTDTCSTISRTVTAATYCGDGTIQTPNSNGQNEECEGSGQAQCGSSEVCQSCSCVYQPSCGNGTADAGEECNEPGLSCGAGEVCDTSNCSCSYTPSCGNGVVDPGEECNEPGLTCGSGETCNNSQCLCETDPYCGDGIVNQPSEECDDGNNNNNDGCFNDCTLYVPGCGNGTIDAGEECGEPGLDVCEIRYMCQACDCVYQPSCGNGMLDPGEACDDGNTVNGDGCDNDCTESYVPGCGNGVVDPGEQCGEPGLTCSAGETCQACGCVYQPSCGNGIVDPGEACDDGNNTNDDGCDNDCTVSYSPECGNGVVDPGEVCDDGNNVNGDGCENDCTITYTPGCGNNVVDPGEECGEPGLTCGAGETCNTSQCLCEGGGEIDLEVEKTVAPSMASVGDEVVWTIKVDNHASITATNVKLYDLLPSGVEYVSSNASQGSYNDSNGIWSIGSIPEESQVVLTITTEVVAYDSSNKITNVACVGTDTNPNNGGEADQTDTVAGNNCDQADITPPAGDADLFIEKSASPNAAYHGDRVTFTITFGNNGTATAHDVVVEDWLQEGFDYVSDSLVQKNFAGTPQITREQDGAYFIITYEGFDLAPGEGGVIEIEADANNEGSACTYRTNTSYINAADATDDSATETVECEGEPTLDKKQQNLTDNGWMTDSRITVDEEDVIQYEVFFGNIGADLENVYLIDYLPEEVAIADLGSIDIDYVGLVDADCVYSSNNHRITCGPFSMAGNTEGYLTFAAVVEDVNKGLIVNEAELTYQGGSIDDQVEAEPGDEAGVTDGELTKTVSTTDVVVGDVVTYTLEFTNVGDNDIHEIIIEDNRPSALELLSDVDDIRDSISPSSWRNGADIDIDYLGNGKTQITVSRSKILEPNDSVSFTLDGEILEEGTHKNTACVDFEDEDGDDGSDCDDEEIPEVEPAPAMCGSLHHVPGRPVLIEESEDFAFTAVCYTTDRDGDGTVLADEITIDCGNGDSHTVYDKHYMAYECEYDSPGTYTVECLVNDETTPIEPHCIDTFIIEEDDNEDPEFGVCGDGLPNDYEHCDLEENNALIGDSLFSRANIANPFTDGDYVCRNCKVYKDDGPDVPEYPEDPSDGNIIPECFYTDSTLSVQYNELFPFWWDVEYDRVALTETCDGEEDYGIFKDTMKCTFEITNDELDSPLAVLSNVDCATDMWQGDNLFDSFEQLIDEGVQIDPGRYYTDLSEFMSDIEGRGYGEYKLILAEANYDYCFEGERKNSTTDRCCMNNFTITKPYAMQKGTVTAKSDLGGTISTTIDPKNFYEMGKNPFGGSDWYQDYDLITAEDFDGGQAVDTLLDGFVDKYRTLAVGALDGWKAVPSKLILYKEGEDVTVSNTFDKPFTMIVEGGDLTIQDDIDVNGMFIVKNGRIIFESDDCNERQSAKGIFITYGDTGGFGALGPVDHNRSVSVARCNEGGLTVKGVMIGDDLEELIDDKRSHLNNWFWTATEDKFDLLMDGASLLIEQNPSLWLQSPPGLSELKSVLDVYRR